jgi:transposase
MVDDTTLGTVVLGLDGFALRTAELVDGEVWLHAETTAVRVGCPECGVIATAHGRRRVQLRDLAVTGRPCRLVWSKRVWRCRERACPQTSWTERRDDVAGPRRVMTERARAEVCRQVGRLGRPVAHLATEYGVGWDTAMAAVIDHAAALIEDPDRTAGVTAIGVDETSFQAAGPRRRTKLGNTVVDDVRRRVQQEQTGHRGHKGDALYGIRRTLLTGHERLTDHGKARLAAGLAAGDPDAEVWYAHHVKELLRAVYRTDGHSEAALALDRFYDAVAEIDIPEIRRLGRTIRRWHDQVLAYWRCDGLSNGVTEAINMLIKRIKRIGHGFRNLANYRIRLLLFCGRPAWQDRPTARIRARSPRSIE